MKIFDCFTFYNELDLLEIRLELTADLVDYFVLVEATKTFQNKDKSLFYDENKDRYKRYQDKIIHVIVDDMPCFDDPWKNERFQREAIKRGLTKANRDDVVIIGDVDEILRPQTITRLQKSQATLMPFRIPYLNFFFNYLSVNHHETYCVWNLAAKYSAIQSVEDLRLLRMQLNQMNLPFDYVTDSLEIIEHAGWHFSYLGDKDFIVKKLQSFAHSELNKPEIFDAIDLDRMISQGRGFNPLDNKPFVPIYLDDYFDNILHDKRWQKYHIQGRESVKNFLPIKQ